MGGCSVNIMHMISARLDDEWSSPYKTKRLIKDVANIISEKRYVEPGRLKANLKRLGWKEDRLDYRTLELVYLFLDHPHT